MRLLAVTLAWTIACDGPTTRGVPPPLALAFDGSWKLAPWSADAGWTIEVVADGCPGTSQCMTVAAARANLPAIAWISRRIDAAPYRGRRVRLRGSISADTGQPFAGASLALRALAADDRKLASQRSARPRAGGAFAAEAIVLDVPADAARLEATLAVGGTTRARFADLTLEVIGAAGDGWQAARPVVGHGLDNLVAFARLYGYVRWFHPSDEAAAADWDRVAIAGVRAVEGARDPAELARALAGMFRPLAPSLDVFPTADPPPAKPDAEPAGAHRVAWEHHGVGLDESQSIYGGLRVGRDAATAGRAEGGLEQQVPAEPHRGGRVRLRAWVRTEVTAGAGEARLYVDVRGPGGSLAHDEMDDRPIVSPEWKPFQVVLPVAPAATSIAVGFELRGRGRACMDDVTLDRLEPDRAPIRVADADLEDADAAGAPAGWIAYERTPGYQAVASTERPHGGKRAACVEWALERSAHFPARLETDLPGGVSIRLPLTVWADATGTLPHPSPAASDAGPPSDPPGFVASGDDRTTRIADVIIAWNVFQHFYPYFDVVRTNWPATLRAALAAAATDASAAAFANTLRRLVAALDDGHGGVFAAADDAPGVLPVAWEWIEGALVVTGVRPGAGAGALRRGDVVRTIDGRPTAEIIAEREALISAATPGWARVRALRELRGGAAGATVELVVEHAGGGADTVKLVRDGGGPPVDEPRPDKIATLEPGIVYVDIARVSDGDFAAAVPQLAAARGIVFDARGYPQGSPAPLAHLTDAPLLSSRWLIPRVTRPDREGMTFTEGAWPVPPAAPRFRAKVAFLADARAISYAETYLGMVEQYHLGEIVGSTTAGTNGNVNPFVLPGGYRVTWTGMKVLKRDGSQHHGIGIHPTIPAERTRAGVAAGRDEVLEAGIAAVR